MTGEPEFTALHRGGDGPPLLLLHGFTDTWRTWELVLGALERRHAVVAPTLAGHAGGPPLPPAATPLALLDAVEARLDAEGLATVDVAGNSLGGYLALQLAARGRARSVTALAPAGGWAAEDRSHRNVLRHFLLLDDLLPAAAARADELVATPEGRRRGTEMIAVHGERIPPPLAAHLIRGAAACTATRPLAADSSAHGWELDAGRIDCPVRIVWGAEDRLLRWPAAAARYRESLPQVDWVVLDGVGHCIQLDAPQRTAELIDEFTAS